MITSVNISYKVLGLSERRERKLVPIPVDLLERLWSLSERVGRPSRVLLEEIINDGLKVYEDGKNLQEAVRKYIVFNELKKAGFIALPSRILYNLLEKLPQELYNELYDEAGNLGRWYGNVLKAKYGGELGTVKDIIEGTFWDATEVRIEKESENLKIILISPAMPIKLGKVAENFISSLLKSLGYNKLDSIVDTGFISIKFSR